MMFQILPEGKDDGRKVIVSDGDEVIATFPAVSLAQAHKLIAIGRSGGWEQVVPKPVKKGK